MYNIESLHYASNTRLHLAKYLYFNTVHRVLQDHTRRTTEFFSTTVIAAFLTWGPSENAADQTLISGDRRRRNSDLLLSLTVPD